MKWHMFDKNLSGDIPGTPAHFMKEQEKKKKEMVYKNEVSRINQQLQQVLQQINALLKEKEEFQAQVKEASRKTVRSTIIDMRYRNNFENIEVAIESVKLIYNSLPLLEEEKREMIIRTALRLSTQIERLAPSKTREIRMLRNQLKNNGI